MSMAIMILQDGETWTGVDQCSLCVLTDEEAEELAEGRITLSDLNPIFEVMFKEMFPFKTE